MSKQSKELKYVVWSYSGSNDVYLGEIQEGYGEKYGRALLQFASDGGVKIRPSSHDRVFFLWRVQYMDAARFAKFARFDHAYLAALGLSVQLRRNAA